MKGPYRIDTEKLRASQKITDGKDLLKLQLCSEFRRLTEEMSTVEILNKTNLHKSDLSRLRVFSIERFTIDRLVSLLDKLDYTVQLVVKNKKAG